MTPEQRSLVLALATVPVGPPPMARQEFLRRFGATDGIALGLDLLRDAMDGRDRSGVELALVVCGTFGFTEAHSGL
ncbi:MAG TPA: hypothetical protein VFJ58_10970 [Armatimonadota bacterium]|nr:hypothetical protein [Armatimonadota bacterium]